MNNSERRNFLDKTITVCWFLMDLCWMCQYGWLAFTFFSVAFLAAVWDIVLDKFSLSSIATICWLSANSMWMIHDLFEIDLLLYAKLSALLGLTLVLMLLIKDKTIKLRLRKWN